MPRIANCSSTSSAKSWTCITRRDAAACRVTLGWDAQLKFLEHLEQIWTDPDEGIWEVRGEPRHFTYSKVMAWVAFDRSIRSAETFGLRGPVDKWRAVRDEIHREVCAKGFDRKLDTFVQSFGSKELDASLLQIPTVGFLPVSDPRVKATIAAIERRLLRDGFVMRYDTEETDDGLPAERRCVSRLQLLAR